MAHIRRVMLFVILISGHVTANPEFEFQEALQIVTSASGPIRSISRAEAIRLFLGYSNRLDNNTAVTLIDMPSGQMRNVFYKRLTDKNPVQIRACWARQVFSGRIHPPLEADSLDEAREQLGRIPNAIGYLPARVDDQRLRVLLTLPES